MIRPGMLRLLVVQLACINCGDDDVEHVEDLRELGPLPRRCRRCKGSVLVVSTTVRWINDPDHRLDWDSDRPRRGRPPKAQARA